MSAREASWGEAAAGAARVAGATLAFALLHSALASRPAKQKSAQLLGERRHAGLYRILYNGQTLLSLGALWSCARRQPDRELYRVRGPLAGAMRAGQAAALGYTAWAAVSAGMGELSGLRSLAVWLSGEDEVRPPPEGQGPAPGEDGALRITGPFRWSRHPLNFAPVPLLWLSPRMTTRLAAFNAVATCYFFLGSRHEEARLEAEHGEQYRAYQRSGCPFYLPGLPPDNGGERRKLPSHPDAERR
ncbi:MAG: methyltransferase family protein [Armatimonadota bacterium]